MNVRDFVYHVMDQLEQLLEGISQRFLEEAAGFRRCWKTSHCQARGYLFVSSGANHTTHKFFNDEM